MKRLLVGFLYSGLLALPVAASAQSAHEDHPELTADMVPARADLSTFRSGVRAYADAHGLEVIGGSVAEVFAQADSDSNGRLSRDEIAQLRTRWAAAAEVLFGVTPGGAEYWDQDVVAPVTAGDSPQPDTLCDEANDGDVPPDGTTCSGYQDGTDLF